MFRNPIDLSFGVDGLFLFFCLFAGVKEAGGFLGESGFSMSMVMDSVLSRVG